MSKNPLVTILIPTYNASSTIEKALESVFEQDYTSLEIIIIDDASTDDTLSVIEKFKKANTRIPIQIITKVENKGPAHSRNIGIKTAKGKYIALLDSDDYLHPDKIKTQITFLESYPDFMGCSTFMQNFGLQNNIVGAPTDTTNLKDILLIGMPFLHASFVFRKNFVLDKKIFYNEEFRTAEDYEWAVRLFDAGAKIKNIDQPLHYYRISGSQESFQLDENGNQKRNDKQWLAATNIHYKIWNRFMPINHPLYQKQFIEIFLHHKTFDNLEEISLFKNWFSQLEKYNQKTQYFSSDFLLDNASNCVTNYILGQSTFSKNLLKVAEKNSNLMKYPSQNSKLKFYAKCIIGYKY